MPRAAKATKRFAAEILQGHKGAAVLVPFDPATAWNTKPVRVTLFPGFGRTLSFPVTGTIAGVPFDGFIGFRRGHHFILVDATLQRAAGVAIGDVVSVVVEPGMPTPGEAVTPRRAARSATKGRARTPSR